MTEQHLSALAVFLFILHSCRLTSWTLLKFREGWKFKVLTLNTPTTLREVMKYMCISNNMENRARRQGKYQE